MFPRKVEHSLHFDERLLDVAIASAVAHVAVEPSFSRSFIENVYSICRSAQTFSSFFRQAKRKSKFKDHVQNGKEHARATAKFMKADSFKGK